MGYKKYSDAEVSEALILLAVNKYNYDKTSETLGIPPQTLRRWNKVVPKKGVAELLERAIQRMLMHIPKDWKGNEWAVALGILMDKWLLVQGKATSREETLTGFLGEMPEDKRKEVIAEAERILAHAASRSDTAGDKSE